MRPKYDFCRVLPMSIKRSVVVLEDVHDCSLGFFWPNCISVSSQYPEFEIIITQKKKKKKDTLYNLTKTTFFINTVTKLKVSGKMYEV